MIDLQQWQYPNPQQSPWQLEGNTLKVQVSEGNMWGAGGVAANNLFLYKSTPSSDYTVQVGVKLAPNRAFEQAGIGLYWDNDNYIKISKEMFNGRLSLVFVTEHKGNPMVNALMDYPDSDVMLRLEKKQGRVIAMLSADNGIEWQNIGSTELLEGKESALMLYTFSGSKITPNMAQFTDLQIEPMS
ncbi:DUF1349 domain-containing protein [Vibrio superstes]|uniref:Beta-xylosidase C-terminal Concanavalin A-like domain-containing protein n=1 Tax=Vibrio superstes NBRC 103154 TaxID=1219062 RepID=A0A511QR18_9VIBR|nr:DUF1349 domain-containing protein [Vibrio superstes]GEM79789.1 hypothetical protein VSU01S_20340 [Vibrio superstes NBRC 103154]